MASPLPDKTKPRPETGQLLVVIRMCPSMIILHGPDIPEARRRRCRKNATAQLRDSVRGKRQVLFKDLADVLACVDDFTARSSDELTLTRGDRVELLERDDDFGDGWYLGKHLANGATGLFPEGETIWTWTWGL
jgi:hypothetical protein